MAEADHESQFAEPDEEADYVCPSCGEVIVVPLDISAGRNQAYVEDCPVCCCPNRLQITWHADGAVQVDCRAE